MTQEFTTAFEGRIVLEDMLESLGFPTDDAHRFAWGTEPRRWGAFRGFSDGLAAELWLSGGPATTEPEPAAT